MNAAEIARLASHPDAPPAERTQARAELERQYAPTRSDLPSSSGVQTLVNHLLYAYEHDPMLKAGPAGAFGAPLAGGPNRDDHKSVIVDKMGQFGTGPGGYRMRPSQFSPQHLRLMVEQVPLLNAIILRRVRTVGRFLRTAEAGRDIGFEVRKVSEVSSVKPRKGNEETALEKFLTRCGWDMDPMIVRREQRDSFNGFMAKSIRDILTLDTWAIETVPTRNGKLLDSIYCVDGGTVFLTHDEGYLGDPDVSAIQIVNGMPVTTYTAEELSFNVMNPRSDVLYAGYGYPYPEMVVKVVTGYLNALTFNLRGFDSNSIPKGMLTLFGSFDETQLSFFRRQWSALVKGVNNAWSLPVMVSDNKEAAAQYTKFDNEFTDLYFAKWMVLLTSIVCSIYGMDPTEVYAESFTAGKSSLSGKDTAERLADARDTGLEPLMTYVENVLSDSVIARISPEFVFRFFGLRPLDQEWRRDVSKLVLTVNELREQEGFDRVEEPWGDAPINPALQGAYQAAQQAAMGGQPGEGEGDGENEPEPTVEESGDRETEGKPGPAVAETDRGDRDPAEADKAMAQGYQPTKAAGDEERSTMMRKARGGGRRFRAEDVVMVG